ncbi:DNA-directed RNA polymerase II subunit 4 [Dictyostelium discoideum AX4]|uniref:DNA-directed RNA polymerase II subunit rpb4 n=1 Tax=Dictyostelium discoideum TaxID=44689 RepID=RPB4_DICDI|nr:DNA-directed RNA polymerase II subunit 4 [Dictyostelium discoideum AX4]Q54S04.1 RecName: Full=DNA-directed RNA polymerase II subunit rpb4; Short=RNA polymerase II subunit B4; AltName: Full=DNA-directed RNA polymerase II subunit D [Dictyostelium discoideum]EAL66229.1 DNA-directed RNA polymerase II subunit 4 [Dictyostelium discoideum AX4]|eukprot:XP_640235.1 DNA-directed RNA polymerase II subunit 4 [Dictyostelium discoideum AX4]
MTDPLIKRSGIQEEEDLTTLKFPRDLKDAKFLLNSEVAILLEHRKGISESEGTEFPQNTLLIHLYYNSINDIIRTFHKTLAYAEKFSRYKNKTSIKQVRTALSKQNLEEFEIASLANLCPEISDEAKSLIPSLKKMEDDELQAILDELSNLRKFN